MKNTYYLFLLFSLSVFTHAQKQHLEAIKNGICEIGQVLDHYYVHSEADNKNELPNEPIILN